MTLRVLFFSLLQDVSGTDELEYQLDKDPATVNELLNALFEEIPKLRQWGPKLLIAVDCEYADRETPINDGQEIALMPPVQGG